MVCVGMVWAGREVGGLHHARHSRQRQVRGAHSGGSTAQEGQGQRPERRTLGSARGGCGKRSGHPKEFMFQAGRPYCWIDRSTRSSASIMMMLLPRITCTGVVGCIAGSRAMQPAVQGAGGRGAVVCSGCRAEAAEAGEHSREQCWHPVTNAAPTAAGSGSRPSFT
ncbi:hypothetical protein ABPG77_006018 [Micractinium sp. CCAP 211/92]